MAEVPRETRQQWWGWVHANIASPFRKRAFRALLKSLASGSTSDQAIAAARKVAFDRANYLATSALVLGALSAGIALIFGGLTVLSTFFAFASAAQGRHSADQAWQAWVGVGLAISGVGIFAVTLVIR
jgi:hypothetical protein